MTRQKIFILAFLVFAPFHLSAFAEKDSSEKPNKPKPPQEIQEIEPIQKQGSVEIDGKKIPYQSTVSKIHLKDEKGKPTASIFYTSYTRTDVSDTTKRPVMFAFNGGPGSSAVWLHLGILGPKRIDFPGDGTKPLTPPARIIDNEHSLLDVCDLVFIDPVSTGYSRAEGETSEKKFHGLDADINSVGDFIRIWITQNKRWDSPKYLCGESYGGVRAAGLANHLQSRYGMSLNGVVLLSSLLDYRTVMEAEGSQLSHQVYLTAFATTALYHGKIKGNRDDVLKAARDFAYGEYALALLKGNEIPEGEMKAVATRLEKLTGVSSEIWLKNSLRLGPTKFRAELLRAEGKTVGRFDSRVAWDSTNSSSPYADYDPSYSLALGMFSTAMLSYLGEELGWKEDQPYEILTSVFPWKFGAENKIVNVASRLSRAMRDNPKMKVLVMVAHTDLATPAEGIIYSFRQMMDLPPALRDQVTFTEYDAGHMFYLNPPDLEKGRDDLVEFLKQP
ncbi:MAG: S10 family peptidase [Akkermansiaceae bacterium]